VKSACYLLLVLAILFIKSGAVCLAQAQCPWMNAETAGGFIGGDARLVISDTTSDGDATCHFAHSDATLLIAVHTMKQVSKDYAGYFAVCGASAVPLRGVGNEAVECLFNSGANKGEQMIVGHVRDRAFIITIKAAWVNNAPSSLTKTRNPVSDNSENIAEQVAGSMF
jgi:hypothetical protein